MKMEWAPEARRRAKRGTQTLPRAKDVVSDAVLGRCAAPTSGSDATMVPRGAVVLLKIMDASDIDGDNRASTLAAPVLLMAGWYDPFLPGQLADFVRMCRQAQTAE